MNKKRTDTPEPQDGVVLWRGSVDQLPEGWVARVVTAGFAGDVEVLVDECSATGEEPWLSVYSDIVEKFLSNLPGEPTPDSIAADAYANALSEMLKKHGPFKPATSGSGAR